MKKTETDIQAEIRVALCKLGCKVFRTNSGIFYTADGRPTRIGVVGQSDLQGHRPDGRAFYIEVKADNGKPSTEQLKFIAEMKRSGAIAGVAWSVDDAIRIITE